MGSSYFLYSKYIKNKEQSSPDEIKRRKKRSEEIIDSILSNPNVADVVSNAPHVRKKRDYIDQQPIFGPLEKLELKANRNLEIPKLPFLDPLYSSQWYLV